MANLANALIKALTGKFNKELFPPVAQPTDNAKALFSSVTSIKTGYEVLNRTRGNVGDSALLVKEVDALFAALVQELDIRYASNTSDSEGADSSSADVTAFIEDYSNVIELMIAHMNNFALHGQTEEGDTIINNTTTVTGAEIDDGAVVTVKTWSSLKISEYVASQVSSSSGTAAETILTVGESVAVGDICGMNAAGLMVKTSATTDVDSKRLLGVALGSAAASGEAVNFLLTGFIATTAVNVGDVLYLSTTPGVLGNAPPTGTDEVVRVTGYATASDQMYFNPDRTWLVLV